MTPDEEREVLTISLNTLPQSFTEDGIEWVAYREELNDRWGYCRRFYKPKSILHRALRWFSPNPNAISHIKLLVVLHHGTHCTFLEQKYTRYKSTLDCKLRSIRTETLDVDEIKSILEVYPR